MKLSESKAHIIEHVNRGPWWSMLSKIILLMSEITYFILFGDFIFVMLDQWWLMLFFTFFVTLCISLSLIELLKWSKVVCDTHRQVIISKAIFTKTIELPFEDLYRVQVWYKGNNVNEDDTKTTRELLLNASVKKIKFIGDKGDHILVENTDKFNHFVNNYLGKVSLEEMN